MVAAFVASAGLCAGAAVALVKTSDRPTSTTFPQVHPTAVLSTGTPAPAPAPSPHASATSAPTPAATRSATPAATASAVSTHRPRPVTHEPTTEALPGPSVHAVLDPASGDIDTETVLQLAVHATDVSGPLSLTVDWGDGTVESPVGNACDGAGDCEDYGDSHTYAHEGTYTVRVIVSNGKQATTVVFHPEVKPSPNV